MKQEKNKELKNIANFLFEIGILAKTPRSGFYFLGSGEQSVAEHINRVCYIGYVLAKMSGKVDTGKVITMCLLHDMAESRVSDLNYVHQKYVERKEEKAVGDLCDSLPFGDDMRGVVEEYEDRKSDESVFVKDADNLEMILSLKEQYDIGNKRAKEWLPSVVKRLKTKEAKDLAKMILEVSSDEWWFSEEDKKDEWWVNREAGN